MNEFRARYHYTAEQILPFLKGLDADRIFAVQHDADDDVNRTHVHVYIENCTIDKAGQKKRLTAQLGHTPKRSDWAYGDGPTESVRGYVKYMLKGKYEPFFVKGVFEEDLDELRAEWVEPKDNKKIQYKIRVENPVQAKARQADLMDQVMKRYIENERKGLIEIIRQVVYVEHKTIVGRYKIRDYVDYVRGQTHAKVWVETMENFCQFKD